MQSTTNSHFHILNRSKLIEPSKPNFLYSMASYISELESSTNEASTESMLMVVANQTKSLLSNWNTSEGEIKKIHGDNAVYVDNSQGKERLVYNRKKMQVGKLYKIEWLGQKYALNRRADDHVDLYEFTPKKND